MTAAGAAAHPPQSAAAPKVADAPPPPVAIAAVDPLTFTDDMPEFPAAVLEALATPVDPSWCELRKVKEDSDRELLYVPWIHYQQVLVKAFGVGGFKLAPRSVARTEGNMVTWVGALFVRIPGTTKFHFIKEAKGECNSRLGPGNAAEGAESDCLTKCCKRLNIFMELYDPAWRAAWERNYKGQHRRERATAAWPAARDAGAPAAAGPSIASATDTTPPSTPITASPSIPETTAGPNDTGEAASFEQLDAITSRLKELQWKRGMVRDWFKARFGITTQEPARILGALTQVQADAALALLMAFRTDGQGVAVYDALLARLRSKGVCR